MTEISLDGMPWWAGLLLVFLFFLPLAMARLLVPRESRYRYMSWVAWWEHRRKRAAMRQRKRVVKRQRRRDRERLPPSP